MKKLVSIGTAVTHALVLGAKTLGDDALKSQLSNEKLSDVAWRVVGALQGDQDFVPVQEACIALIFSDAPYLQKGTTGDIKDPVANFAKINDALKTRASDACPKQFTAWEADKLSVRRGASLAKAIDNLPASEHQIMLDLSGAIFTVVGDKSIDIKVSEALESVIDKLPSDKEVLARLEGDLYRPQNRTGPSGGKFNFH